MSYIKILSPKENSKISLLKFLPRKYILDNKIELSKYKENYFDCFNKGVNILNYNNGKRLSVSKSLIIKFESDIKENFILHIENEDGSFKKKFFSTNKCFKIRNLVPQSKYIFYISTADNKVKSKMSDFEIIDNYRFISTSKMNNVRDIGGKITVNGKMVKYGLLFRGPEIVLKQYEANLSGDGYTTQSHFKSATRKDLETLCDLGIKYELDLRGYEESNKISCSILSSKNLEVIYHRVNGSKAYGELFRGNNSAIKETFECIANYNEGPLYLHCWGGADRTGTICFLLEAMLGVKLSDLVIDYECTSFIPTVRRVGEFDELIDQYWQAGDINFYSMIKLFLDYKKENETIEQTITRFLVEKCEISINVIEKIKNRYLIDIK